MGGPHEGRERDVEPRAGTEPDLSERAALSRRRVLQLSSLGIAGGVLATPVGAQSLSQTLTLRSNGGRFSYTVSVSGELEKSSANGATIDPNDTISGSTATGQGGGGGVDSYEFSGEIESFAFEGDATVTLNGSEIDPDGYPDNVLSVIGTGDPTDYRFSVSGSLEKSTANGGTLGDEDEVSGSSAEGYVSGGTDSYVFSGELTSFTLDGNAMVTLNGKEIDPERYSQNILSIEGTGSPTDYRFSVSGSLEKSTANGGTLGDEDEVSGSSAEGYVSGGTDSYTVEGEVESLSLDGDATVTLNGTEINPEDYSDNELSIEGNGTPTDYRFVVSGKLSESSVNGGSLGDEDEISGSSAEGYVSGGTDSYAFSGNLVSFTLNGDATVTLNGTEIDPSAYNLISITADSRADYTFSVTSGLEKSTANGASIDSNDDISGSTATGYVNGGTDAYTFAGELINLDVDGNAMVRVNGETIADSGPSPVLGIHSGISDTDFATIDRIEEWQDAQYPVQTIFIPWNSDEGHLNWLFDYLLPRIWDAGRIPLITWEPYTPGASAASVDTQAIVENQEYSAYLESLDTTTPDDIEVRIANGEYDDYLKTWVWRLRQWLAGPDGEQGTDDDRRAYIRLAHEMNGDWYPWSPTVGNSSASSYVEMWRHVHDQFRYSGIDTANIEWMWCVNAEDQGSYTAEELYPGDDYVDWLSVDGYQWGTSQDWSSWRSPEGVFGNMLGRVRNLADKPVCIAETASSSATSSGSDPARKDDWIRSAFEYFDDEGIDMWCWFNEDKETDWAMFNGRHGTERVSYDGERVNAYTAYREGVDSYSGAGAAASGATPLTSASFNGE